MAQPTLTNNSPSAGYIAWTSFTVSYSPDGTAANNVTYTVSASNTNKRFVIWTYNAGSPTITTSDTFPGTFNDKDDQLLFVNRSGVGIYAYRTGYVPGDLLIDGTVFTSAIATGAIVTNSLAADAVTSTKIAADAVTARAIAAGAVGAEQLSTGSFSKNVVINPSFEDWDTSTIYNYVKNPYASVATTDWTMFSGIGGTASMTRITNGNPDATHATAIHCTWSVASTSSAGPFVRTTTLTPGNVYSAGAKVKPGTTQNVSLQVQWYNASNSLISNSTATAVSCTGGSWTQLTLTNITAPAGTSYAYVYPYLNTSVATSQVYDVSMAGLINGSTYTYYDGDSDGAAWQGTIGDSATIAMPYEWAKFSYATGSYVGQSFALDTTSPVTGTKSLGLQAGSGGLAGAVGRYYPVTPNDDFFMRARGRCTTVVSSGMGLGMVWYDKTGTYISADLDLANTANAIRDLEYYGSSPSNAAYARPILISGVTSAPVYFDDVEMGQRVTGVMIKDGAIQATKLTLGSTSDNKLPNGNFQDVDSLGTVLGWSVSETYGTVGISSSRKSGNYALSLAKNVTAGQYVSAISQPIVAAEGRDYYVGYDACGLATMASGFYMEIRWLDASQAYLSSSFISNNIALSTTFAFKEGRATAPTNTRYLQIRPRNGLVSSTALVDNIMVREAITGTLAVNGTITGITVVGSTIKTSTNSNRLEIKDDGSAGVINFYSGSPYQITQGYINPGYTTSGGNDYGFMNLYAPVCNSGGAASIQLKSSASVSEVPGIYANGVLYVDSGKIYARGIEQYTSVGLEVDGITKLNGGLSAYDDITMNSPGVLNMNSRSITNCNAINMSGAGNVILNGASLNNTSGVIPFSVQNGSGKISGGTNVTCRFGADPGTAGTSSAIVIYPQRINAGTDNSNISGTPTSSSGLQPFWASTINAFAAYNNASDARLKTEISDIDEDFAWDTIANLRMRSFKMPDTRVDEHDDPNRVQYGIIAQETLDVLPSAILGSEDKIYSASYQDIWAINVKVTQQLQQKVETLENTVSELCDLVSELQERLAALE